MIKRTICVTGAAGSLGRVLVPYLANRGHQVIAVGRDHDPLTAVAKLAPENITPMVIDVTDREAIRQRIATLPAVDTVIPLVGTWVGGQDMAQTPDRDLETMLAQHVCGTWNILAETQALLRQSGLGRICMVTSTKVTPPPGQTAAYAAGKSAQESLVRSCVAELGSTAFGLILAVSGIDDKHAGQGVTPEMLSETIADWLAKTDLSEPVEFRKLD